MKRMQTIEEYEQMITELSSDTVTKKTIGQSVGNKPITAYIVTDDKVEDEQKQLVLVTGGMHGNEWGGVLCAYALIRHLAMDRRHFGAVLKNQKIVVVPCVNVDGYRDDTGVNRNGINLSRDFLQDTPQQPETRALWSLYTQMMPDLVIDIHAYGGAAAECTSTHFAQEMFWDEQICTNMADAMNQAAEHAGYPQMHVLSLRRLSKKTNEAIFAEACYRSMHALWMGIEVNQATYEEEQMIESCLAKMDACLAFADQTFACETVKGYANHTIDISFLSEIRACGNNAHMRRENRVSLWKNRSRFTFRQMAPEHKGVRTLVFLCEDARIPIEGGISFFSHLLKTQRVRRVLVNGFMRPKDEPNGWTQEQTLHHNVVCVPMQKVESCVITIYYETSM